MTEATSIPSFVVTVGKSKTQKSWSARRKVTWQEFCSVLTQHEVGEKDGTCFIPAVFKGKRRTKNDAENIGILVLDCDTGEPLEQIRTALRNAGWAAAIYSTHSHLITETEISKSSYEKKEYPNPEFYLIHEKGMQAVVAAGAHFMEHTDSEKLIIRHNPCPKFRVVIPLAAPWKADEFSSQEEANEVWSKFVMQAARSLGLQHDQSCTDSARLYYFPRHPEGAEFITEILEGAPVDPGVVLSSISEPAIAETSPKPQEQKESFIYVDPVTAVEFDLVKWAAQNAESFDIANVLQTRKPEIFTGYIADGYKHHIRCVNSDAHTKQEQDNATFIVAPPQSLTKSFVYCCMHAHCKDHDRLFFIKRMLEEEWLSLEDLREEVDEQPELNFDEIKEKCESLNSSSHPDEIKAIISQIASTKADPIHTDALLNIIKKQTNANLKALRQSISLEKEANSNDTAYLIAQKTLDTYFAGGQHLIRAEDKSFWRYTGKYWTPISDERVQNYILPIVKKYADPLLGEEYRKMMKNALDLTIGRQAIDVDFFMRLGDRPAVINCQNGELWLQPDGGVILKPHSPESYLQYVLDVKYDPHATSPTFDQALLDTFRSSSNAEEMVRHLEEMMGYFIQPSRFLTCWFMWQGDGSNGKTRLFETLGRLMSLYSIYSEKIESIEKSRFGLGYLVGKLLFVDDDVDVNTKLPDGLLKKFSERKLITGEKKFKDTFEYISSVAPLLLANNYPLCDDLSHGTKRRVKIIPFKERFDGKSNPYLHIWENEMPGVLNRLIQGLQRLRQRGDFLEPEDCVKARQEWLIHANPFNAFMDECCEPDVMGTISLNEIFVRFNSWKLENGYSNRMSLHALRKALKSLGYDNKRINGRWQVYGLCIR